MPLAFLLDENQRGPLWRRIRRHNRRSEYPLDAVRVGDEANLSLGVDDPQVLLWAERANRILVTRDRRTLAKHLAAHVAAGHHSPGVFQLRDVRIDEVAEFLVCAAYASEPEEWENRITFVP